MPDQPRARDLGIPFDGEPGPSNGITDVPGVEGLRILTTNQQFRRHLEEAVEDGELPPGTCHDDLLLDLGGVMYGGILMAHLTKNDELKPIYERQLDQLVAYSQRKES